MDKTANDGVPVIAIQEMQEDNLWAPTAKQWSNECEAYKQLACAEKQEDDLWASVAQQWVDDCRAYKRYLGMNALATTSTSPLSLAVQATRERRKREKKARNANKHRTADLFRAATQNFNGGSGQEKLEELVRNMVRRNLGIVFGQEGRRRDDRIERWDTGEIFISAGSPNNSNNSRKKDGNFFVLNGYWAKAFVRGGRRMKIYNPRLMTLSLPLPGKKWLYLVNVHFPDSGKTKSIRDAYWVAFEKCVNARDRDDIPIIMGDFNASMGRSSGDDDLVCGSHGSEYQNESGRRLKSFAGMHKFVDLISWETQELKATYYDIKTRAGRQLDRAFILVRDWHLANTCANATMLVDSDHEAVILQMEVEKPRPQTNSIRTTRLQKDIAPACEKQDEGVSLLCMAVQKAWVETTSGKSFVPTSSSLYDALQTAVSSAIEDLQKKTMVKAGWWDSNDEILTMAIDDRNKWSRIFAKSKTANNMRDFKSARKRCKKAKWTARNNWFLDMAGRCNVSLLPGKAGSTTNPGAIWTTVRKLKLGASKWKPWQYQNIRNAEGIQASTPSQNADNFAAFYHDLFDNSGEAREEASSKWYEQMPVNSQDRSWLPPQMWELETAIRDTKNTAPGMSGIPASVWKALSKDVTMKKAMLAVLQKCWEEELVPPSWKEFYMTVLPKKGDLSNPGNWRGISIRETFAKLYTIILKKRLNDLYETIAPDYSNGFRAGRGRSDCIFALLETLRRRKQWGLESWVLFFDAVKMFDRIPRQHVWKSMRTLGICEKMIRVVQSTLQDATGILHIDQETRSVPMPNGTGQGTVMGPILCNLFLLPVLSLWLQKWKHHGTVLLSDDEEPIDSFAHIFADDTCIVAANRQSATALGTDFTDYLLDFSIAVHIGSSTNKQPKTAVVYVPTQTPKPFLSSGTWPDDDTAALLLPPASGSDHPRFIPMVKSAIYLGHRITNCLSSHQHMLERMNKTTQLFGALRPNFLGSKNVWRKVKTVVFQSMILPTLLDGVECCVLTNAIMNELTTTYHRMVRSALNISPYSQRKHRLTSETMLLRLGLQPLHYYVDLKTLGYAGHVQRMHSSRLPKLLRNSTMPGGRRPGGQFKSHLSFLKQCMQRKNIQFETWHTTANNRTEWAKAIRTASTIGARITTRCREKLMNLWASTPTSLIGKHVEKRFRNKHFVGTIVETDKDTDTNEQIWHVKYDDSDSEDYDEQELQKILCDDFAAFESLL